MKKFIAGLLLGLLTSSLIGFAAAPVDHDGNFWGSLNNQGKTGYINGYSDAMQVSVGKLDYLRSASNFFHWKGADKIIHELSHQLSMAELTPDQAVKKLDTLYSNPKYSELDLGQALQLLAAGTPLNHKTMPADATAPNPSANPPASGAGTIAK
ncbi:MAG TPA: hypothetical protein VHY56_09480 [Candidatus Binataceae bacterium]|jgi:hypothetical protein|nr:hypothetical protein [Candidatus Binataceae bacterium]